MNLSINNYAVEINENLSYRVGLSSIDGDGTILNMKIDDSFIPIKGFENHLINDQGYIYTTIGKKFRKYVPDKDGYLTINFSKEGKFYCKKVHRLVAEHFIPNPKNLPQVNHKKGIKTDNRASELEWCTGSENLKHSYDVLKREASKSMLGRTGSKSPYSHIIFQLSLDGFIVEIFNGIREAVRQTGIPKTSITKCRDGHLKHARGYIWK